MPKPIPVESRTPSGREFLAARLAAGLTQIEAAKALGVTQSYISQIETGGRQDRRLVEMLAVLATIQTANERKAR